MITLVNGIRVEQGAEARMRDGCVLRADIFRPPLPGTYPVLLMRVPYNRAIAQAPVYQHPSWYALHGYVVVIQDCRGRFGSDGEFDALRNEALDGYDSVQWASQIDESDGQVGMYGFSYAGATQLLAASEQPPALKCCIPAFTASDYFDGWMYEGGAFKLSFVIAWSVQMLALNDAVRRGATSAAESIRQAIGAVPGLFDDLPLRDFALFKEAGVLPSFFDWLDHDTRDDYWKQISLREKYDRISVPCLHIGGWYDIFASGTVRNYSELERRAAGDPAREQRLLMGPWIHVPWAPEATGSSLGESFANRVDPAQLAWFDRWLKGKEPGADYPAPVGYFVMGANAWQEAEHWPPQGEERVLRLASSGRANSRSGDGRLVDPAKTGEQSGIDIFVYDPNNPVVSAGGASCCNAAVSPMGQACQAGVETRNDVLVYTSDPLAHTMVTNGTPSVVLYAATTAPDTDWVVRLADVAPDGHSVNVTQGIVRARYGNSLEDPQLRERNRPHRFDIALGPTSWAFKEGHRIRLQVTSSDYPAHLPNANTGGTFSAERAADRVIATQAVLHDDEFPSELRLPSVLPTSPLTPAAPRLDGESI